MPAQKYKKDAYLFNSLKNMPAYSSERNLTYNSAKWDVSSLALL